MNEMSLLFYEKHYPIADTHRETRSGGCVYALFNPLTNLTKVGYTYELDSRLRSLLTQSGNELLIVAIGENEVDMDAKVGIVEHFIHDYFKLYRVVGEWFKLSIRQRYYLREFLGDDSILGNTVVYGDSDYQERLKIKQ